MARNKNLKFRAAKGLPRDLASALGRMIARHSTLEISLANTLYMIAGVNPKIGRVAIGNPRSSDVLSRMQEIAQVLGIDLSPFPWNKLSATLDDLKRRRDIFAHSQWVLNVEKKTYFVVVTAGKWPKEPHRTSGMSKRIKPEGKYVTATDLRLLRKEIETAIQEAQELFRFVYITLQAHGFAFPQT